jgi:hypothetical protein
MCPRVCATLHGRPARFEAHGGGRRRMPGPGLRRRAPLAAAGIVPEPAGSRLIVFLLAQLLEQQFGRRPVLFRSITRGTAGHHIASGAASTPGKGYDVVHSQCVRGKCPLTVGTDTLGNFIPPPLGLP